MAIDVSTHQLAELTSNATNHKISVDDILNVWHSIGYLNLYFLSRFLSIPSSCLMIRFFDKKSVRKWQRSQNGRIWYVQFT